ncbi:glycosyltransferase family A protein [Imperialibacter roseus]|uniref:Glycosyltransferase family A protein n=1 Tax=Imperialibacter roseus TaxID=1324217 RepID=A0ABZ0IMM7_9BACT|nr:glycosyltransferase family A protein [Imperialibacter roseus]WOK06288.1 glycosyltransferase family A protein [Imperialibacter roseus]
MHETQQQPLVSVIVICYNQEDYVIQTLEGVKNQSYTNIECLIVDDGSQDNTKMAVQRFCDHDRRFRYIHKENGGPSSARNVGLRSSQGIYILPLDGDDYVSDRYIELAVDRFAKFPNTDMVYCKAEFFGERQGEWELKDYTYRSLLLENSIFCSSIFKTTRAKEISGYDESLKHGYEDWDFNIRYLTSSSNVYVIPETCFFYRISKSSRDIDLKASVSRLNATRKQVLKKNFDIYWSEFDDLIEVIKHWEEAKNRVRLLDSFIHKSFVTRFLYRVVRRLF